MTETDPLCLMSPWPVCSAVEVEDEGMSGVQLFFTILFSILGLGVLAVIGLMVYSRWKENKRKRFYWSQNSPSTGLLQSVFVSQCLTPLKNWNTQPEDVKENWTGSKPRAKKTKDVTAVTYIFRCCCRCYGRSSCFSRIFMLKCVHLNLKHNRRSAASALTKTL